MSAWILKLGLKESEMKIQILSFVLDDVLLLDCIKMFMYNNLGVRLKQHQISIINVDINEQLILFYLVAHIQCLSKLLFTLLNLHDVNRTNSPRWWRTHTQLDPPPLTLSGQLTSLTDKTRVLHLNQLPIKLMVLVLLHQAAPIPSKWSEVMSHSSFLMLRNSIYLDFYITLTSEIMGWDKHIFLDCGCGVEFSQCWEQTKTAVMSVCRCRPGRELQQLIWKALEGLTCQNSSSHRQVAFYYLYIHWHAGFCHSSVCSCQHASVVLWSEIVHWRRLFHPVIPFLVSIYKNDTMTAWCELYLE